MDSKKITRIDLVEKVRLNTKYEKQEIQEIIEEFLIQLKQSLKEKNKIELRGFGTFDFKKRSGKKNARNPKTGEKVCVEPHSVVYFKAGQDLKKAVWKLD